MAGQKEKLTSLKQADVLVYRNEFTTIPTTVFEHEIPILKMMHGNDAVQVKRTEEVDVEDFDAGEEYARLKRKYKNREGDFVGAVFGHDPANLAKAVDVSYAPGRASEPPKSVQSAPKKGRKVLKKK